MCYTSIAESLRLPHHDVLAGLQQSHDCIDQEDTDDGEHDEPQNGDKHLKSP